ncbi:MAG TPA: ribbon-helix-helix protein, CopG family [Polyangia bacterium]|jgi:plasmid stability protein
MVRTQIQLPEAQHAALKALAAKHHVSVAEMIRRGVEQILALDHGPSTDERRRRALAAAGRFSSGRRDISARHDEYLAEDYRR